MPRPPALLTAATRSGPVRSGPIGAAMMGCSIPSRWQRFVFMNTSRFTCYTCGVTNRSEPATTPGRGAPCCPPVAAAAAPRRSATAASAAPAAPAPPPARAGPASCPGTGAAPREGQVAVVRPADVEPVGLGEHLRVAVRRPQRQVEQVSLADRLAAQHQILPGNPLQELGGAVVAQALF